MRRKKLFFWLVIILLAFTLSPTGGALAQTSDLFFSEYIEGSSFNKALEIYNGTGAEVDLSAYTLELYSNGAAAPSQSTALSGMLADGDVYVIAHGSADTAILDAADAINSSVVNFNGDDAVVLRHSGSGAVVDAIGQVGTDPGNYWGSGDVTTQDHTLRRLEFICVGDTDPSDTFDPAAEWNSLVQDTFDGLGIHTADCGSSPDYTPIYDIQYTTDPSGNSPLMDQADVTTEGIVTALFQYGYFIEDPVGGFWNGLWVHDTTNTPTVGDRVQLTGTVVEYFNLTELDLVTGYQNLSSGNPLPDPVVLSTLDVSQEQWESVLVRVENVAVTNPDLGHGEWSVSDGSGDVRVDDAGSYTYTPSNGDAIDYIVGPLDYTFGDFKIQPRDDSDIGLPVPPSTLVINEILADPASDSSGDANGDGVRDSSQDEFVEIVNNSDSDVDISGWTLADGVGVRHTFPEGTVVSANCTIVVFGGGTPTGGFGGALVQTASTGLLGLNNDGDTLTLNDGSTDQATVSYGSEGGDNQSLTRDPDISGSFVKHSEAAGSGGALFSPGTSIDGSLFAGCSAPIGACGTPATLIHDVQGSDATSPLVGMPVIIEGVVVGDFQNNSAPDNGDLNGFYLQEEDAEADANPETSEGILVYAPSAADVQVGDHVRVAGEVQEYSTSSGASLMTELGNVSDMLICETSAPVPSPTEVTLPVNNITDFERYEGMLVTFTQNLVISEYFNFDRFNEIVLALPAATLPPAGQDRSHQPTAVFEPGSSDAAALAALNTRSRITLDDGRSTQNPDPAIHPNGGVFDLSNTFRGGDIVQGATGVVDETFGLYRIQPTAGANYVANNPRPTTPEAVGGSLKVSSFNVLNYFLTIDAIQDSSSNNDPADDVCGPNIDQECRGADDANEFDRQRAKILSALSAIDADIFGLIEMENTTGVEPLQDIVDGLNDQLGVGTYDFINTGTIGGDAIKVGLIYKPATVTPLGNFEILDSTDDPRFDDTKSRPVLAQTFQENATGGIFTVAVNHLKSKGSECGAGDDDPEQGSCNVTRTLAAQALVDWLATDPTNSGDPDFLIMGDLNSYDKEDPIDAILAGADDNLGNDDDYTDLIFMYQGEFAYSYVFDGQVGYLDHGLANASLTPQVTGVTEWHINSDEPDILDYDTSFKQAAQDALYEPNAFRASDHDPVIIGLDMVPRCEDKRATIYVADDGLVYGGPRDGKQYRGLLLGTQGDDVIVGTNGRDMILGLKGNDVICGLDGWDLISGHKGNDVLLGGAGNDKLKGDQGDDILDGGDGRDLCHGGSGTDSAEACEFTIRIP